MKTAHKAMIGASIVFAMLMMGCSFLAGTTPPGTVTKALFNTVTNYVLVPIPQTNYVTVTVTNSMNQVITQTNQVISTITNVVPVYGITTSANTTAAVQTAGTVVNGFMPGVGTAASAGVLMLLSIWGHLRGIKYSASSTSLAQEVETMLEFIQSLPQGAAYKSAITTWLQSHQVDMGTANTILGVINSQVSNPDAKAALTEIQATIAQASTAINTPAKV